MLCRADKFNLGYTGTLRKRIRRGIGEHGVRRIYTTDTDFLQFRALEIVNPLQP